ncbi:MAG: thioredoxin family protein [Acidobacteria bacterium]|nr:thioredoxin family protein [Acidobacteriota bacterium]
MAPLLSEQNRKTIRERLREMKDPVRLVHFTQELECETCAEALRMMRELTELSDKLSLEVYNLQLDRDQAARYGVDKVPGTVVAGTRDYGIRLYGLPSGFEFAVLMEDILMVSSGGSGLADSTTTTLRSLTTPVHLQVFATPMCPYCPTAAHLAHQFALESDWITADLIEATQFPELAERYNVRGVPHTVVNETETIIGSLPELEFVDQLLAALGQGAALSVEAKP